MAKVREEVWSRSNQPRRRTTAGSPFHCRRADRFLFNRNVCPPLLRILLQRRVRHSDFCKLEKQPIFQGKVPF